MVIYGSYAQGTNTIRSDIDVAVIAKENKPQKSLEIWRGLLGSVPQKYDVKVFELLPLEIKAGVMDSYFVIFGEWGGISEYFYHFRKLWKDVKPRFEQNQFSSFREKKALLQRFLAA